MISTRSLRIVHVGNSVRGGGGIASVIRGHLARSISAEILAVCTYDQDASGFFRRNRKFPAAVWRIIQEKPESVVHVHLANRGSLVREGFAIAVARLSSKHVVVTIHGSGYLGQARFWRFLARVAVSPASVVHVFSGEYKEEFKKARTRLVVMPNDVKHVALSRRKRNSIMYLGEVGYRKGIDIALECWSYLVDQYPDWNLIIAGPATEFGRQELARWKNLARVDSVGEVAPGHAQDLLSNSRILIQPSRAEAFPMSVCESLMAGSAVLGSDVGAMGRLLHESGQILIEPMSAVALADALRVLMDDSSALENHADTARQFALNNLSSDVISPLWNKLYLEMVGNG